MVLRLRDLRPLAVGYLWAVGAAMVFTGSTNLHPVLGRLWDAMAIAAALCAVGLPFIAHARARAFLVGMIAFVCLVHATEWLRLTGATAVGLSIAALWVAALVGVVSTVAADQERSVRSKITPP